MGYFGRLWIYARFHTLDVLVVCIDISLASSWFPPLPFFLLLLFLRLFRRDEKNSEPFIYIYYFSIRIQIRVSSAASPPSAPTRRVVSQTGAAGPRLTGTEIYIRSVPCSHSIPAVISSNAYIPLLYRDEIAKMGTALSNSKDKNGVTKTSAERSRGDHLGSHVTERRYKKQW